MFLGYLIPFLSNWLTLLGPGALHATAVVTCVALIALCLHLRKRDQIREVSAEQARRSQREIVEALALTINAKDEVTHGHVLRVQVYAAGVARILGCNQAEIEALKAGALLHDVGKIAVPDYILNKPGKLTAAEFEKMKVHTVVGAQILSKVQFSYPVVPIVRHHHERWDGKGYPDGLKGEEIPVTARVLSVVDCFDALREDRPYRQGMSRESAIDYLLRHSGTMYDPHVVRTFISNLSTFEAETKQAQAASSISTSSLVTFDELPEAARAVEPAAGLAVERTSVKPEHGSAPERLMLADKELSALYDLTQHVRAAATREEMATVFAEKLRELVHYDSCAITLTQPETGEKLVAHAAGRHGWLLVGRKIVPGEGVTGWVLANQRPFSNTDPRLDFPPALAERFADYRTLTVYPLSSNEWKHGAVSLYSMSIEKYTEEQQHFIQEAAMVFANALSEISNQGLVAHHRLEIPTVTNVSSAPDRQSGSDYSVN